MAQFPPTTTPRAAGDGTIVTMASDSPFAQPESTAGDLFPVGGHDDDQRPGASCAAHPVEGRST